MDDAGMSQSCKGFARWHVEPPATADGVFRVGDAEGHRVRRKFFTAEAAELYAAQLEGIQVR